MKKKTQPETPQKLPINILFTGKKKYNFTSVSLFLLLY